MSDKTILFKQDSLLDSLVLYTKLFHKPFTAEALMAGLPVHNSSETQELFSINNSKSLFSRVAGRAGLKSTLVERPISKMLQLQLPMILLLSNDNTCILENFSQDRKEVKIIYAEGDGIEEWLSVEDLESEYLGFAFMLKKEFKYETKNSRTLQLKQKHWFWSTIKLSSRIYSDVLWASLLINLFVLATPLFTMNVYDRVLPNNAIDTLWALAIGIFIIMIFDFVLKLVRAYYIGKAGKRADVIMSNKIFDQLLNLRLEERPSSTGMFVNRLQSFESVREFFATATVATIVDIPFIFIFIAIIFYIGGALGWISLASVIIALIFSWIMQNPIKKTVEASAKEDQLKHTTLNETVAGLEIIKSVRGQNRMKTHWDKSLSQTAYYHEKSQFLSQIATFFTAFISQFSNIAIVIGGVYLASEGDMTMGGIIAAMMLNGRVVAPVSQIVGMIIRYDRTMLSLNNIDEIMNMQVERENKAYLSRSDLKGDIQLKDVSFSYKDQNFETLKNLNLTIKEGEKIAILGKIGSGKSTLAKLIQNLYVPTKGSILIDQTDVRQIDPVDLRRVIGVVPQEPFLFMGSIKDNITISEPFATDEEILRSSKIAGVHDFLGKHESGYDLIVGERGQGLSGGEIQSVTLARALITNPNILILDEPTNSMDRQSEKAFVDRLSKIVKDETLILITHKTSILSLVDRIIILDDGKVIADGPKDKILSNVNKV